MRFTVIFLIISYALTANTHNTDNQTHTTSKSHNPYKEAFGSDYDNALNFYIDNKTQISNTLDTLKIDNQIVLSVVFPELIRYSLFRDFLETKFLEVIYVKSGSDYADFSVGRFQMKPSFAEQVEQMLHAYPDLEQKYFRLLIFNSESETYIRKIRIERLKSVTGQLLYLAAFYELVNKKFNPNRNAPEFYAAAYNLGLQHSKIDIRKHITRKGFPFGTNTTKITFSYSEITLYFYEHYYHSIFG